MGFFSDFAKALHRAADDAFRPSRVAGMEALVDYINEGKSFPTAEEMEEVYYKAAREHFAKSRKGN